MPHRILIVDDSKEDRYALRRQLSAGPDSRYDIAEADSAEEALRLCDEQVPDCVLVDYNMPVMSGLEFLKKLTERFPASEPAVIMLTGQGNEAVAVEAMKAGALDYLVKGIAKGNVLQAIDRSIDVITLRRRNTEQARQMEVLAVEREELLHRLELQAVQLSEDDRRKDEFLATLAHELRNPLAPMRYALRILQVAQDNPEAGREACAVMERQLAQMVRLIDDLLDMSRISQGKVELRRQQVDLASVLKNAVEASEALIATAGHNLIVELPGTPVLLDGDPARLTQVFSNLLNNSAKYTRPGGRIKVDASVDGDAAQVSIIDSGIGIAPEHLPRIFDMFAQGQDAPDHAPGGLGIGLTLARRLLDLHGGNIEARSAGRDQGSQFIVRLPTIDPPVTAPETATQDVKLAKAVPRRILIADDNRDAALSLETLLGIFGHETMVAFDGREAVVAAEAFQPDLIFLDIGMPHVDGYEACRQIRRQPWGQAMTVVALTGWGQDEDRRRTTEAGFDMHLVKPIDPPALDSIMLTLASRVGARFASARADLSV